MQTSDEGLRLIRNFEGLRLEAYRDAVGVLTIGYGHVSARPGQKITQEEAEALLRSDVAKFERCVERCVTAEINQYQFDALVSFAFNLGCGALEESTLLRKVNDHDYEGAVREFSRWVHAGGRILLGLVKRRLAEAALFRKTADQQ